MNRRDFFTGIGSCSLAVLADHSSAAAAGDDKPGWFDRIAPPETLQHMAGNKSHMALMHLETAALVAAPRR